MIPGIQPCLRILHMVNNWLYSLCLLQLAHKIKFLTHHLANGKSKYMGVCRLSQGFIHRRIDLRLVPYNSYACAVLYFTGSDVFNVKMRETAIKHGYSLNEYALTKTGSSGIGDTDALPTPTERHVFRILNMAYKEPRERQ